MKSLFLIIMKSLFLITCITILSSCNSVTTTETTGPPCCANIDAAFGFRVENSEGEDLLNPNTPNYYVHSGIEHYAFIDGAYKLLSSSEGHLIQPPEPNAEILYYSILIGGLGGRQVEHNPPYSIYESFLRLSSNDTDTIQIELFEDDNNILSRKIWYNSELIWAYNSNNNKGFTIVK